MDIPLVLFTDLDGTLLDHHTYSPAAALTAVRQLQARGIPIVFCSSKTPAEQVFLQDELGMRQPFIFENGSGIAVPEHYFPDEILRAVAPWKAYTIVLFARKNAGRIIGILREIGAKAGIELRSLSDLPAEEHCALTGLSATQRERADARWATVTLATPLDTAQARLLASMLADEALTLSRGGRFYTVQDAAVSKGAAIRQLLELFRRHTGLVPRTVAVGDSPNDLPMFRVVDTSFLVQRPDGSWADVQAAGMERVRAVGPTGFSEVISRLIHAI